jgi:TolB protein
MNVRCFFLSLLMSTALAAQENQSPVITVRKGASVVCDIKELGGANGPAAAAVLRNDIQLSGALSLGDSAAASVTVSGTAAAGSFGGQAVDKTGGVVLQKTYSGDGRRAIHEFTDDLVKTLTGQRGIAMSRIAFVANRTGHKEIYLADYDGANAVQLTHDNAISVHPSLSADARRLAYTGYQSGYADIYLIDLASGARTRVIKFPGTNTGPTISPDSREIACTLSKDGNPELYLVGINGDSPQRLTRTPGVESSPTFSPNGNELIYCSDNSGSPQLYRISSAGGTGRLIVTGFGYCTEPNWSPDGSKVAFNVRSGGSFQVAQLDLNAGSAKEFAEGENPVWGPDSRHLLFSRGSGLYMFDTVGSRETRVIGDLGRISEPTWSR